MSEFEMTVTEETETQTYTYITINQDYKLKASVLADICKGLHQTDDFMGGLINPDPEEKEVLDSLEELGLAQQGNQGKWFEKDVDGLEDVYREALSAIYDEDIEDIDSMW